MALVVKEMLVDDLDGSEAKRTVKFSVAGKDYVLDLSDDNYRAFMGQLEPFILAARRESRRRRR